MLLYNLFNKMIFGMSKDGPHHEETLREPIQTPFSDEVSEIKNRKLEVSV